MNWATLWFTSIILTILIWGTWLIFSRKASAKLSNPFFENLLITFGALVFNLVVFLIYIIFTNPSIDFLLFLYPFLSGILWAFAGLFAFIAVSKIGVGKAMSIWAPSGMVVSFLWWVLYYWEFSGNLIYACLSVAIIVVWVVSVIRIRNEWDTSKLIFSGAMFAVLASLIWGWTYLIPIKELSDTISPFITLLPLSIGMFFWALWIFLVKSKRDICTLENIKTWLPIIYSGIMWALWNLFAIIAVLNIWIGKAYPLAELCGIVNAIFAVFFLREITDKKKIRLFFIATLVSFAGAIWLSILKI